jgi:hypothetical protein
MDRITNIKESNMAIVESFYERDRCE